MTTMQPPVQPTQQYGGYPQQFPAPQQPAQQPIPQPAPQPSRRGAGGAATLAALSVVAMIVGLSVEEDGSNQWSRVHAWGALAVAAAVLTLAPAFGRAVGLGAQRAAELATAAAGALVLFWVLFTLPVVGSNTSLILTIGVAAGCAAVWLAQGRDPRRLDPRGW